MLTIVSGLGFLSASLARLRRWSRRAHGPSLRCAAAVLLLVGSAPPALRGAPAPGEAAVPQRRNEPIRPIPLPEPQDPYRIALGRMLFEDPRLSHDRSRACVSCHDTTTNGADAQALDRAQDGQLVVRNTNTVFNAALSFRLEWLGDARTLEEQANASLRRSDLMASTPEEILGRLNADEMMVRRFQYAYRRVPDWDALIDALATYERTLLTPDSRFDRWLAGEDKVLTADELEGYRIFKAAGCVSCHQGVNVGGNLFEKNGIFRPLLGSGTITMRVPSLRNVAVTPPYFHDGSVARLGDAVQDMAKAQLGRSFTEQQLQQVVAFLHTLTGRYQGRLLQKPAP